MTMKRYTTQEAPFCFKRPLDVDNFLQVVNLSDSDDEPVPQSSFMRSTATFDDIFGRPATNPVPAATSVVFNKVVKLILSEWLISFKVITYNQKSIVSGL